MQIKKNKEKKLTLMQRLQEEMGRFKLNIDQTFGKDRKLCKKNITERTKFLIEKFQSKKRKKDGSLQTQILNNAKEQAQWVKLDFELEKEKAATIIKEDESKYYQAIRKLKFDDHHKITSRDSMTLKRMQFNASHDVLGIEKAIATANKMCKSNLLKVGLLNLQGEIDQKKMEITR